MRRRNHHVWVEVNRWQPPSARTELSTSGQGPRGRRPLPATGRPRCLTLGALGDGGVVLAALLIASVCCDPGRVSVRKRASGGPCRGPLAAQSRRGVRRLV